MHQLLHMFHPALMGVLILVALYVFYTGTQRARMLHFGHKARFAYGRHVFLGAVVVLGMVLGMPGGMYFAWHRTGELGSTGWHFVNAVWYILPLLVLGGGAGWLMHVRRAKRLLLPVFHGLCMVLLVALALCQASTGVLILRSTPY
ncbi:hypothetical protein JCM16814_13150 [Desulfobaculum senezii]|jgi:uncharacterized membrane protein